MTCLTSINDIGRAVVDLTHAEVKFVVPFLKLTDLLLAQPCQMFFEIVVLFFRQLRSILRSFCALRKQLSLLCFQLSELFVDLRKSKIFPGCLGRSWSRRNIDRDLLVQCRLALLNPLLFVASLRRLDPIIIERDFPALCLKWFRYGL